MICLRKDASQCGLFVREIFIRCEVCPFERIFLLVVEFLVAIRIANVAPGFRAGGVILEAVGGDCRIGPGCGWIGEERAKRFSLHMRWCGDASEIRERRIDRHEVDGSLADRVWLGQTGHDPDERRARGLFPESKLTPVLFLAKVPAVIPPQHDDRVFRIGRSIEAVDQTADHRIGVGNRGEIRLNRFSPSAGFHHGAVIAVWFRHFHACGRDILEVIILVWRQLDLVEGMHVEIFAGNVPRHVRLVQPNRKEERLVLRLLKLIDPILDDLPFAQVLVAAIEGRELDSADARIARRLRIHAGASEVVVPFFPPWIGFMVNLPGTLHDVAGFAEGGRQGQFRSDGRAPVIAVVIDAGGRGPESGHQCGAGGIANGSGAVAACETRSASGESINIWGDRLFVSAQVTDPVVQVVDGDEQDVGLRRELVREGGAVQDGESEGDKDVQTAHAWKWLSFPP
jgi:hypothetical protein